MDWLLSISALLLVAIGIVGCIVPIIPGVALAYAGLLCSYFCSFSTVPTSAVWIFLLLTVAVSLADYFLPAYMTKLFGGTKAGMRGATAGLIVGIVFGNILGAIAGPFVGAVIGELMHDGSDTSRALKIGFGSFLSFIVGTGMKLALSIAMLVRVWGDIYPVVRDWAVSFF